MKMQSVVAIIRPSKLETVKDALVQIGVNGITVTEARGHGRQKGHTEVYRGREYAVDLLPKIRIETVVAESLSNQVVNTIIAAARTGEIGDGKIFIYDVADAIRIRNEQRGESAL
jgi:nitrogen regulatory protein P-II 1